MDWIDRHPISTAADLIRQMLGQIHAVMKQADDIDGLTVRHPEDHQMAAFSAQSCDMQCPNTQPDIVADFAAHNVGTIGQRLQCKRQRFKVLIRLKCTELIIRPNKRIQQIEFGLFGQPD